jgi:hypothetical protein
MTVVLDSMITVILLFGFSGLGVAVVSWIYANSCEWFAGLIDP